MKWIVCVLTFAYGISHVLHADGSQPGVRVPAYEVFQFMQSGTQVWADGSTTRATAYLWIPEHCQHLRGLIIMGTNVPEQMLVENPAIRRVASANDLGIVWSTPTFWHFSGKDENQNIVSFLQELLNGLAKTSGYDEVATVPWLPVGESFHLLMVDALVEAAPQRCIAGIWLKNAYIPPANRTTPALVIYGTAQEWGQDKVDLRTRWNDLSAYDRILAEKAKFPNWPLTLVVDGGSGHFDMSERLINYVAHYIDIVTKARLSADRGGALKPVELNRGFLADLPIPGHGSYPITAFPDAQGDKRAVPWFIDRKSALEAQSIAAINWKAETQLPGFIDASGNTVPFNFNGISNLTPIMEADGVTFGLRSVSLNHIPENFVNAGEPLAKAPGEPEIEWLSGPVTATGNGKFRIALDRSYPQQGICLLARVRGTPTIRDSVQPIAIRLQPNDKGKPQEITFMPLKNVKVGSPPVPLVAKSDAGLPVEFFVVAGPAFVQNRNLVFTKIPPRSRFPIKVTVAAWQWGRSVGPPVMAAETVKQTLQILP